MVIPIGTQVKLKEYTYHGDWEDHKDEIATIIANDREDRNFGHSKFEKYPYIYRIRWENGSTSLAPHINIQTVNDKLTKIKQAIRW